MNEIKVKYTDKTDFDKFFKDTAKALNVSISGGSGEFIINGNEAQAVSIQGADFYFNTDTKVANFTIQSAEANNFSINGAEVQQVSLSGGEFVIDSTNKIANVTLSSGIESVSVVSEAGNASIDNKKLFLDFGTEASNFTVNGAEASAISIQGADFSFDAETKVANFTISGGGESSKTDPQFIVTPTAVTLGATETATLNVEKTSPAPFTAYLTNSNACNASITADKVILTGKTVYSQTDLSCNFALLETQNFKPAFVDVPVTIKEFESVQVLCHFEDSATPYLNEVEGYTITSTANLPTIGANYGYFGSGARCYGSQAKVENLFLGGKDFTVDFRAKISNTGYGIIYFASDLQDPNANILNLSKEYCQFGTHEVEKFTTPATAFTELHHYAYTYQHSAKIGRFFIDGVLTCSQEVEFAKTSSPLQMAFGHWYHLCLNVVFLDELRIWNGTCEWTENFTPPTQPY